MLFLKNKISAEEKSEQAVSSDKVFLHSITVSLVSILICLVFLSASTWAWFSEGVSTSENVIQTGRYNLTVSVTKKNSDSEEASVLTPKGTQFVLSAGTYTVTLTSDGTGGNGYARILIGDDERVLHTNLISAPGSTVFTLVLPADADVYFDLRWGRHSGVSDVQNGGTLSLVEDTVTE